MGLSSDRLVSGAARRAAPLADSDATVAVASGSHYHTDLGFVTLGMVRSSIDERSLARGAKRLAPDTKEKALQRGGPEEGGREVQLV